MPELLLLRVAGALFLKTPGALVRTVFTVLSKTAVVAGYITCDLSLGLISFLTPKRKIGFVIGEGVPGHKGIWPEFISPLPTDSRSPCPFLNALANHGEYPVLRISFGFQISPMLYQVAANLRLNL